MSLRSVSRRESQRGRMEADAVVTAPFRRDVGKESEVFDFLVEAADRLGESAVRQAWTKFKNRKARAIAAGATAAKRKAIPKAWTTQAWTRQNGLCARCGESIDPLSKSATERLSGDHSEPISTGGEHASYNISAMHARCNSTKGNLSVYEDCKRANQSLLDRERLIAGI